MKQVKTENQLVKAVVQVVEGKGLAHAEACRAAKIFPGALTTARKRGAISVTDAAKLLSVAGYEIVVRKVKTYEE